MSNGWFKLHRSLLDHEWLGKNDSWFKAWIYIMGRANYETGHVNLTEIYRELKGSFSNRQWRHFVSKLEADNMLENVQSTNLGDRAGHQQTARIAKWSDYQSREIARSERRSERGAPRAASAERTADQDNENGGSVRSERGAVRGASAERMSESNKNTSSLRSEVEEVKEEHHARDNLEILERSDDPYELVREAYNEHRGNLPECRVMNSTRKSKIRTAIKDLGSATEVAAAIAVATAEAANDPEKFYERRGYGLDTLLAGQKFVGKAEAAMNRGTVNREDSERNRILSVLRQTA